MTNALVHRGPDDHGEYVDSDIGLGMRRLSIIDRARGQQPMPSEDGALTLVFNGEIYNYKTLRASLMRTAAVPDRERYRSRPATAGEFGEAGILRLEGMFAFALWDQRRGDLTLARDWLGQKSLYWTETADGFAFASEIKALLTLPGLDREVDLVSLSHYMSLRYLPGDAPSFGVSRSCPPRTS